MGNDYLTILAGNPRGGEKTWQSLKKHVLIPLNSDLAICTGTKWIKNQSFLEYTKILLKLALYYNLEFDFFQLIYKNLV